ncbi:peptidylprolyl isomerase [Pacificimonas pallii]|nr:peptidylprolyl isomerase [Pacificimonas pallii]
MAAIAPAPAAASDAENILNLDLSTGGRVVIRMRPDLAPNHVERFRTLARQGFYDGVIFHRVIPGFMAQTGDPTGTGTGGSELPDLEAEFTRTPHLRGTVSAARAQDENSANSQFFIVFMPRAPLDENYTIFGRVISGMQYVDSIAVGEPPANPSRIVRASIGNDVPAADVVADADPLADLKSQLPPGAADVPEAQNRLGEDGAEQVAEELAGEEPAFDVDTDILVDTPQR